MSLSIYLRGAHCSTCSRGGEELASLNITHNVVPMWSEAGVYAALYESHGTTARNWLEALRDGVRRMTAFPNAYRTLDAPNGWGTYADALGFLREWLAACERHPDATIEIFK